MLICLNQVLSRDELKKIRGAVENGTYQDGKLTALGLAKTGIKDNLQLDPESEPYVELGNTVLAALQRNETFKSVALPKRFAPPIFNRYEKGMEYGAHFDSPIMVGNLLRTDLSVTVFLSDPASYDGGELSIEGNLGWEQVKLMAGDAVLYPATTLHSVEPVTRGVRLAAVTWVQSLVRDQEIREILHDLLGVFNQLKDTDADAEVVQRLHKAYATLLRREADV